MKKFQVAYVPIGVPTFHLESAQIQFDRSVKAIESITDAGVFPKEMLLSIDLLDGFLDTLDPDLIILQNITFANAAYACEVLNRFDCPILLWTLREPVIDGGRLRLNSLTGAYSAANAIKEFRDGDFQYIFGGPEEDNVVRTIAAAVAAAKVKLDMKQLKMTSIGHTPQGFGFGRALDLDMMHNFGVTLNSIEARELIEIAKGYSDADVKEYLDKACAAMKGMEAIPEKNQLDFARLYRAYSEYVDANGVGALSSRCWPDFFTAFGTPVCAVLAMLNDHLIPAGCEADAYGTLSMFIGSKLSGQPTFFGDPVSMDEKDNTITFWHCGTAACSLAREGEGACVGVHCNRKIGPTLDFGCKPSKEATIFRIGRKKDGTFRFFIAQGEALDMPKQFTGTSVVIRTKNSSADIVNRSVKDGWEPHFAVVYGDYALELEYLAEMLKVEVCRY